MTVGSKIIKYRLEQGYTKKFATKRNLVSHL